MNRGDRREAIFGDDKDRERFLDTLSSYPRYLAGPAQRPAWLRVDRLLGEWGIPKDSAAGREVFAARLESRRREDLEEEFLAVESGWCLEVTWLGCCSRNPNPGPPLTKTLLGI
jgi:hypothetical protein